MDTISFDDFEKVEIRIGTVKKAEVPQWSHAVIKMTVDFGEEIGTKTCFSSIMDFYKPEDLESKQFPFVINLEPKTIGPEKEPSEAMMIMASPATPEPARQDVVSGGHSDGGQAVEGQDEEEAPVLFQLPKKVPNGTKVF